MQQQSATCCYFNPRSDERSDDVYKNVCVTNFYFNPRSDERSDYNILMTYFALFIISIHAPTNGATCPLIRPLTHKVFQSTLRRTERRNCHIYLPLINDISIHAPTNGATSSDHTGRPSYLYFNPRSDERSDSSLRSNKSNAKISIHAPTNGATLEY